VGVICNRRLLEMASPQLRRFKLLKIF